MGIRGIINPSRNCFQLYVKDNHWIINSDPSLNYVTTQYLWPQFPGQPILSLYAVSVENSDCICVHNLKTKEYYSNERLNMWDKKFIYHTMFS